MFFGFSHCPEICPNTLKNVTETLALLGEDAQFVKPVFISVDPARDTVDRLNEFMTHYAPQITALTGTEAETKHVIKLYKIFAQKTDHNNNVVKEEEPVQSENVVPEEQHHRQAHNAHYGMNHSSLIYVMDKQGSYVTHISYNTPPAEMVNIIKEAMAK